ncbi:MAG: hypothetical protein VZR06_00960 [Butyrivibrio sp.]|nr:hypothetical protein [Butyrivibrio sp.]
MTELKVRMQKMLTGIYGNEVIGERIYLLFFALTVGTRAFGWYDGMVQIKAAIVICAFLFLGKILVTKHTAKEYAIIAALMLLAGLVYINTDHSQKGLIECFMMMLGMKKVDSAKVIRCGALVAGPLIMLKIFLGAFGLASEIYYPQTREGAGTMFRHAFGYAHPNTLHMNTIMITMMCMYLVTVYLKGKENSKLLLFMASVAAILFNLYVFQYSGSRTGVLASVVYVTVNYYLFVIKKIGLLEKILSYAAFPVTAFISIVLPHILPDNLFDLFNGKIFNTRFALAKYFWSNNSISLFGISLINPDESYRTYGIDMSQLYLFLQLGIVAFVVMFALITFLMNRCIAEDKRAEIAVMVTMLFIGIWEPLLYNLSAKNFTYVFIGSALYAFLESIEAKSVHVGTANEADTGKEDVLKLGKRILVGVATGVVMTLIYLAVTKEPTALYGARERDESNKSLGMKPEYYTSQEIAEFKKNGDIVIDYDGQDKPMYKYDETLAVGEYRKKVMSVGVWTGMIVFSAYCGLGVIRKKKV